MGKYDEQLQRMMNLMNYDNSLNESKKQNNGIEYHTTAADGKEYGIIKEGRYYYLKTTTPDKKNISESYDYVNGFNRRGETRYNSYNEATKQLETRLIAINESYGKHEDVSIANLNKTKDALAILTEDTRKELDRMHSIFENSFISKDNIGNHGNPESKGSATGANTTKNNAPFEEKTEAKLDKDMKENGTVEGATSDHTKVNDADSKLQHADKMENGKRGDEDYKDTHDDLEGDGVADKKPSGAKAVKMNESFDDLDNNVEGELGAERYEDMENLLGDEENDESWKEFEADFVDSHGVPYEETFGEEDIVGVQEPETDFVKLDDLLREFLDGPTFNNSAEGSSTASNSDSGSNGPLEEVFDVNVAPNLNTPAAVGKADVMQEEEKIIGPDEVLDGPHGSGNTVHGEETMDKTQISEDNEVLDGPHGSGNSVHGEETMDKIEEAVERITRMVVESLCKEEKKCKCGKKNCTCKDGECTCDKNVNEGQGWNVFKHGVRNFDSLPDNDQEYDKFFKDDELTNYEHNLEGRPYYDENGGYTDDAYDLHGMRHGKVEDTTLGKLGRKAGIAALKGMSKGKIAKKKWDLAHPKKQDGIAYLQEAIDKIVKEEVAKLDVWGKHPRYRKEPMTTPANKEVLAGTAEKDWNDESTKGEQPYGQKIGSSAPFEKTVNTLTEKVFEAVVKSLKMGK
jgi:hypothetical protein